MFTVDFRTYVYSVAVSSCLARSTHGLHLTTPTRGRKQDIAFDLDYQKIDRTNRLLPVARVEDGKLVLNLKR